MKQLWPRFRFSPTLIRCALLLGLAVPVAAFMPVEAARLRTSVAKELDYAQVLQLQGWVNELSLELAPDSFLELLSQRFPEDRSVGWTFYSAWTYLDRLDQVQSAYILRVRDLEQAQKLLNEYENRCHLTLRTERQVGRPRDLVVPAADSQPQNLREPEQLVVFRALPWPDSGYDRAQVQTLLQACHEDQQRAREQQQKIEGARQRFSARQDVWTGWVSAMAEACRRYRQPDYARPFGPPLPPAPAAP